jgi:hypothetical protein
MRSSDRTVTGRATDGSGRACDGVTGGDNKLVMGAMLDSRGDRPLKLA